MRLFFVRHAETTGNSQRMLCGNAIDSELTLHGVEQAGLLAHKLKGEPIVAIYCSPMRRARQTAAILGRHLEVSTLQVVEELQEIDMGLLVERQDDQAWASYHATTRRWLEGDREAAMAGGESLSAAQERFARAVDRIFQECAGLDEEDGVIVVSHGTMMEFTLPGILARPGVASTCSPASLFGHCLANTEFVEMWTVAPSECVTDSFRRRPVQPIDTG